MIFSYAQEKLQYCVRILSVVLFAFQHLFSYLCKGNKGNKVCKLVNDAFRKMRAFLLSVSPPISLLIPLLESSYVRRKLPPQLCQPFRDSQYVSADRSVYVCHCQRMRWSPEGDNTDSSSHVKHVFTCIFTLDR